MALKTMAKRVMEEISIWPNFSFLIFAEGPGDCLGEFPNRFPGVAM